MRAIISPRKNEIAMAEVPIPKPKPYEALVRIEACAFCNHTDTMFIRREFMHTEETANTPLALGHESAGIIIELGEKVKNFKVGQRVLRAHIWGHYSGGIGSEGAMSDYGVIQDLEAIKADGADIELNYQAPKHQIIPDEINGVQATIIITLKETLQTLRNFDVKKGEPLGIVGTGPVGRCFTYLAKSIGASPIVVFGIIPELEEKVLASGADMYVCGDNYPEELKTIIANGGLGKCIEAVGSDPALRRCLEVVGDDGKVQLYGAAPGLKWEDSIRNDPRIIVQWPDEEDANEAILELVANGSVKPDDFVSHILQPEDYEYGYELIKSGKATKVVFKFVSL